MMSRFLHLIALVIASLVVTGVEAQGYDGYPEDRPLTIAWTRDSSAVAVGRMNGMIEIYSSAGVLQTSFEAHSLSVAALSWNADGSRLASGGWEGWFRIWTPKGELVYETRYLGRYVNTLEWDSRGEYLVVDSLTEPVSIWETDRENDIYTLVTELEIEGTSSDILWNSKEMQIAFAQKPTVLSSTN